MSEAIRLLGLTEGFDRDTCDKLEVAYTNLLERELRQMEKEVGEEIGAEMEYERVQSALRGD